MLSQNRRLKHPKLFKRALASTPFFRGRFFVVFLVPHRSDIPVEHRRLTAFGIIISKKVDKRAVVRNRIKRQLREALRQSVVPRMQPVVQESAAVVLLVRQASVDASYQDLVHDLIRVLAKPERSATIPSLETLL